MRPRGRSGRLVRTGRHKLAATTALAAAAALAPFAPQLASAAPNSAQSVAARQGNGAGSGFGSPDADAKPMVRAWWPDAASGESAAGRAMIAKHIDSLAKAGVGGLEIAFLSDRLTAIPQSSTLPAAQQLGQPGVDQSTVQTKAGQCCVAYPNVQAKTIGYGTQNRTPW